jgi:hypothetical protein
MVSSLRKVQIVDGHCERSEGFHSLKGHKVDIYRTIIVVLLSVFIGTGCDNSNEPEEDNTWNLVFTFRHCIQGNPLAFDTLLYTNATGNTYLVSEIQYFISDVTLYKPDGSTFMIDDQKEIHYVDTDIQETRTWEVFEKIPAGYYDSVSFTFGISEEKNLSGMFVNPPESYMFWPESLGGGYHYMKLNGKWLEPGQTTVTTPFNCHLGIGQIYYSYPDSITDFIHNDFRVSLPGSDFTITKGQKTEITLTMSVDEWFTDPHDYDFNVWGSYTMQNQEAMQQLTENGHNVFSALIE